MTYLRKIPFFICFIALLLSAQASEASSFIRTFGQEAINTLTHPTLSDDQIRSQFRSLLGKGFDVESIANFVLGRNLSSFSEEQKKDFLSIFQKRLENAYASRFKEYQGVSFSVKSEDAKNSDGYTLVKTIIQKPGGPEVKVDWKVSDKSGSFKIYDVIVDGFSMSQTQRSDYAAAFESCGKKVTEFLDKLRAY